MGSKLTSTERKILYALSKLGRPLPERVVHRLADYLQKKGVKLQLMFTDGYSHKLSQILRKLVEEGYVKEVMMPGRTYSELYRTYYTITEKGKTAAEGKITESELKKLEKIMSVLVKRLEKKRRVK